MRAIAIILGAIWIFVMTPFVGLLLLFALVPFFGVGPKGGERLAGAIGALVWTAGAWVIIRLWRRGSAHTSHR